MATTRPSMNAADIQRRMAQIRHDMHQEVQGAVQGARTLTDWKSLVRSYPWVSLSIAAAIGYLVVPARRKQTPNIVAVAAPGPEILANARTGNREEVAQRKRASVLGTAFSLFAPLVIRAAQSYALTYFEQWLANHPLMPSGGKQEDEGSGRPVRQPANATGPVNWLRESR
jgi:hypothetical protein